MKKIIVKALIPVVIIAGITKVDWKQVLTQDGALKQSIAQGIEDAWNK